jgi:hypothetical protein
LTPNPKGNLLPFHKYEPKCFCRSTAVKAKDISGSVDKVVLIFQEELLRPENVMKVSHYLLIDWDSLSSWRLLGKVLTQRQLSASLYYSFRKTLFSSCTLVVHTAVSPFGVE